MALPFNLFQWIEDNKALLQPPVGNKNLYPLSDDYIVMIVGGPNARKDYHFNETEELFFQLKGNITVYTQENGQKKAIEINEGEMYLHPAKIPHSPARTKDSIGLVIEKRREGKGYQDGLIWHCEKCNELLHEVYFELHNIEKDFLPHFAYFYGSEDLRTCKNCGHVMETDPKFVAKK